MIEKLKLLTGTDADEDSLNFYVSLAKSIICSYCGTEELPAGLEAVCVLIASDLLKSGVSSIKEGDMSIEFSENDGILKKYSGVLAAYARLRTVK